ncbi:MAG: hypothetical protein ACJAUL_003707 [Paraglaciecola sp.]|jgi:hypothetical protein
MDNTVCRRLQEALLLRKQLIISEYRQNNKPGSHNNGWPKNFYLITVVTFLNTNQHLIFRHLYWKIIYLCFYY